MNQSQSALAWYKDGFSCSQAVLASYGEQFGLDRDLALKLACGFGGGMGGMGKTCGSVTGAFMVIGLKYGRIEKKDKQARIKTHDLVREFVHRFESIHGSIKCNVLLGVDMRTPEGAKLARDKKLYTSRCPRFIRDAITIIDDIL